MLLIRGSLDQLQLLIEVSIAPFERQHEARTYRALIDTGATRTCLTARVCRDLGLPMRMKLLVASAQTGPERRRAYGFSLGVFCDVEHGLGTSRTLYRFDREFVAPDFRDNDNFDVLLGMDLISEGRLQIGRGEFELRLPEG